MWKDEHKRDIRDDLCKLPVLDTLVRGREKMPCFRALPLIDSSPRYDLHIWSLVR